MKDKVVIVTGASEGVGRATALRLAREGAHVVICARRAEPLKMAAEEIKSLGGSVEARPLDVADLNSYATLIADTGKKHGRLDGLVNNAFSVAFKPLQELTIADWRRDFAVNCEAIFVSTQEALKLMIPQRSGSIVNISSTCGLRAMKGVASYSASKAALIHFTSVSAIEAAPHNVRINCVVPGWVETPSNRAHRAHMTPQQVEQSKKLIPLQRGGESEELASAIRFLLSDESSYITGVSIPVDGGSSQRL